MAWPTLNLDTLEKPRSHPARPHAASPAAASRMRPDRPFDQARRASERLDKLVSSLTAKATKTKVAPRLKVRKDKTISYEAYLRRKQLCLRALAGLALAGLSAVLISGLAASSGWSAEGRAKRLTLAQYEAGTLTRKITEMDQQVQALNGRAEVQANYMSQLRADPAFHDFTADEAKAAAIGADLERLTREEFKLRGKLHALGKEIIALQGP
jgi:hypothetical protein